MPTHLASIAITTLAAMHPAGVVLKRVAAGSYVNGLWVDGAAQPDTPLTDATVHAMKPREREDLPDGLRHDDMRVVHTRTQLTIHTDNTTGDVLVYNGRDYKVLAVRERFEGDFFRAVIGHNHARTNSI